MHLCPQLHATGALKSIGTDVPDGVDIPLLRAIGRMRLRKALTPTSSLVLNSRAWRVVPVMATILELPKSLLSSLLRARR